MADLELNALEVLNGLHDALTQAIDRIICEDVDMERITIRLCHTHVAVDVDKRFTFFASVNEFKNEIVPYWAAKWAVRVKLAHALFLVLRDNDKVPATPEGNDMVCALVAEKLGVPIAEVGIRHWTSLAAQIHWRGVVCDL